MSITARRGVWRQRRLMKANWTWVDTRAKTDIIRLHENPILTMRQSCHLPANRHVADKKWDGRTWPDISANVVTQPQIRAVNLDRPAVSHDPGSAVPPCRSLDNQLTSIPTHAISGILRHRYPLPPVENLPVLDWQSIKVSWHRRIGAEIDSDLEFNCRAAHGKRDNHEKRSRSDHVIPLRRGQALSRANIRADTLLVQNGQA